MSKDMINKPSHYLRGGIEARKVIRAFELSYHCGDAVAYILRSKFKGSYLEDLKKAVKHLEFEIEECERETTAPEAYPRNICIWCHHPLHGDSCANGGSQGQCGCRNG